LLLELTGFDVLSDVLATLGLQSRLFCRSELSKPWSMEFAAGELLHFHIVERGSAWLEIASEPEPMRVKAGDLLIVQGTTRYRLVDEPLRVDAAPIAVPTEMDPHGRYTLLHQGKGKSRCVMLCGSFMFERTGSDRLSTLLPRVLRLRSSRTRSTVKLLSQILQAEVVSMRPGTNLVVSRLTDVLFTHVLREWLASQSGKAGWLTGIADSRIGPVLALIHEQPGAVWSVARLARRAGSSRSSFTARFTRVVGESPQNYLTRVRMEHAARQLREGNSKIAAVAATVGYESESSFNKAFRRIHGETPGRYRRTTSRRATQTALRSSATQGRTSR
jgi:AraC-like DNA-binding protein